MKNADIILEIEALTENLTKHFANNNLLKMKALYFINQYQNLSVSMIIEKLGIKKSNFAALTKDLEKQGLIVSKQGEIDKRCRLMSLTEKGKEELDAYSTKLFDFFSDASRDVDSALTEVCTYLNKKI